MAEPERTTQPITDEIATAAKDMDVFSGWLRRLENPDPVLRTEASGRGLKLYDEVSRDPHAASALQTRYLAVAGCEWEVLSASDAAADEAAADLIREAVEGMNFSLAVQELLQAVLYGFYVGEVMWTAKSGRWMPAGLVGKHPRRFSFTAQRELRLITPANMIDGEAVPDRKFVVFTWGSQDNPYGCGLGQKLWWPVWFKKHGVKWWMVFLEKFGQPTAWGKYVPGADPTQQQALLDALTAIQTDTSIKTPNTVEIELLEAKRGGEAGYEAMAEFMDRQISRAILGQTLTSGGEGGGSYALGKVHEEVRQDIVRADADLLCETLNQTLVRWVVDYNLPKIDAYPKIWIRTEPEQDLKALAERDRILLVDMGLSGRVPESYITETYGLPMAEEGEATLPETRRMEATPGVAIPGAFAEPAAFTPDQQAIDDLIEDVLPDAGAQRDRVTNAIRSALEAADSYEEMLAVLAETLGDADVTRGLADAIARTMFAGQLWGQYAERSRD